jgi:predicted DNA-binding ArsR family transcriptional regulator
MAQIMKMTVMTLLLSVTMLARSSSVRKVPTAAGCWWVVHQLVGCIGSSEKRTLLLLLLVVLLTVQWSICHNRSNLFLVWHIQGCSCWSA